MTMAVAMDEVICTYVNRFSIVKVAEAIGRKTLLLASKGGIVAFALLCFS